MRVARLFLPVFLALTTPAFGQGIDPNDPCYKTLTGPELAADVFSKDGQSLVTLLPRVSSVWSDRVRLNQYIGMLAGVLDRYPNVAMALDAQNGYFNQGWGTMSMLRVENCIPWLEALLSRLEDRLRELGGVSGTTTQPRPGGGNDPRFEQMRKRAREFAELLRQRAREPVRRP